MDIIDWNCIDEEESIAYAMIHGHGSPVTCFIGKLTGQDRSSWKGNGLIDGTFRKDSRSHSSYSFDLFPASIPLPRPSVGQSKNEL